MKGYRRKREVCFADSCSSKVDLLETELDVSWFENTFYPTGGRGEIHGVWGDIRKERHIPPGQVCTAPVSPGRWLLTLRSLMSLLQRVVSRPMDLPCLYGGDVKTSM